MSLEEKIRNAKKSDWVTKGIPKWKVRLWVFSAKLKLRFTRMIYK